MNKPLLLAAATLGAITAQPSQAAREHIVPARFGETVFVGPARVTPLRLLADSRCPSEVTCVWRGEVRIAVRVRSAGDYGVREMTLGKAIPLGDGQLELTAVMPARSANRRILPADYRFAFRYTGGFQQVRAHRP